MSLGNIHLTPQLVQAVRDAVDIVSLASEHTRLTKAGRRYQGLCPLHKEKTPSFSVDPVQNVFYCFGCGAGGDAIKLHMQVSGDDFPSAIESLARRYGIPLPAVQERRGSGGGGRSERDLESVLAAAAEFFVDQLKRSQFARSYLEKRRMPKELIERYGLGYAPDGWRTMIQALQGKIQMAELDAAGLTARPDGGGDPYDRFRNRLMFPIKNASGRLVGFGGRTLGDDKAKYINTAETERFHKGLLLYGLDQAKRAIRDTGRAYLVEGYFDVLGTVACGVEGAVAGMGTALTPEQAKLLSRYAEEVVVGYDGDNAGENAFRRALPLLLAEGLAVRRTRWPEGHDPDSLRLERGEKAVSAAFEAAGDAVRSEIERLSPPETATDPPLQAQASKAVTELLRPIPDAILRYGYAKLASDRLAVPVELLTRRISAVSSGSAAATAPSSAAAPSRDLIARAADGVRSLEEQVLEQLLAGDGVPPAVELPIDEVFLDAECRNIYRAFRALYPAGRNAPPDARSVQNQLSGDDAAIARVARLVIENSVTSGKPGRLSENLDKLTRRWQQQRSRELVSEILDAQRRGDEPRARELSREQFELSQVRHSRSSRPGVGSAPK